MSRIRTLKPEVPTDRKLAQLSIAARYTFVLCITQADDEGLLRAEPREILASLYPHDRGVTSKRLEVWLGELIAHGFLRERQTVDGARVLEICNWKRHQKIDHPAPSRIGPLVEMPVLPTEESASASRATREDSATPSRLDLGPRTLDLGPGSADVAVEFLQAWGSYPKRAGTNSKTPALRQWQARIAEGVPVAELLAGTERYAKFCRVTEKWGTEYVMQAKRFYGRDRHWEETWAANGNGRAPAVAVEIGFGRYRG